MNREEQNAALAVLIRRLLEERREERLLPEGVEARFQLFRALCNVRPPRPIGEDFLALQDKLLQSLLLQRGTVSVEETETLAPGLRLWRGDITRLGADAIVNAANAALLGCFVPLHACIDNCIHSYAGVQLRLACAELMRRQGYEEPTGLAKRTPGFNLPAKYVLHTVGPIVDGALTGAHERQLQSCYASCLRAAAEAGCASVAFCCISTGVFHFPNERAAALAIETVREKRPSGMDVIFNVFSARDEAIYRNLLS